MAMKDLKTGPGDRVSLLIRPLKKLSRKYWRQERKLDMEEEEN